MKIGILTIATGKYIQFVRPLYESMVANFLPGIDKASCYWTDNPPELGKQIPVDGKGCVTPKGTIIHTTKIERRGFPGDTLYRYHYFLMQEQALRAMDLLFYFDADMLVHSPVTVDGDLAPLLKGEVKYAFTMHPGFTWNGQMGSFETRIESRAWVSPSHRRSHPYVAGGFNGGQAEAFLEMSRHIKRAVDEDVAKGITAVWHDESYLNACHAEELMGINRIILHPGYCYPESWVLPFHKYILALDKNHAEVRS